MGRRHAVLIANQSFPRSAGKIPDLQFPHNDVDALEQLLRDESRGFFDVVEVVKDGDPREIETPVFEALRNAASDDLVLLYYAGHGILDEKSQSLYLATREAKEDNLLSMVDFGNVNKWVDRSECAEVVVMLDCCFAGAAGEPLATDLGPRLAQFASAADSSAKSDGLFILSACGRDEVAVEHADDGHGVFTGALLQGIRHGDADLNERQEISLWDLCCYLKQELGEDGGQQPAFYGREGEPSPLIARCELAGKLLEAVPTPERSSLVRDIRWHVLDQIAPTYILDPTFHMVDWNPAFELLVGRHLNLVPGDHAEEFISKLKNAAEVVKRSNQVFTTSACPMVDVEILEFPSSEVSDYPYGLVRFQKIASQVCDERGRVRAWVVQLNVLGADKEGELWKNLSEALAREVNWTRYALSYDNLLLRFPPYRALVTQVVDLVDDAHRVLDLGAGTGNGVVELLQRRSEREILAIEKNATMLDHLRKKLQMKGLGDCSVTPLKGDIISCLAKEVGPEYFDAAIMINVLYALDDPADALNQVARTMKRGGILALSTPTKDTDVGKLFAAIEREIDAQGELEALRSNIEDARARHDAMDSEIHRDSTADIVRYVSEAGFEIVEQIPNQYEEAVLVIKAVRL